MALVITQTINYPSDLAQEFERMNRDYFSYDGYQALLDYFDDTGDEIELDVIAICCEFNETSIETFVNDYRIDIMPKKDWLEYQEIPEEDRELFDDDYEEYKIETIREYADAHLGWYQLLNDDTSIIYRG